ncbi:suppressor of fused domain protein [Chryseobacterium flavum]|uniref:suppressor of fused domain protein n=1 Tax=Chryseobacterium flavum TaxID=415851 RepID=UPI002FDA7692
MKIVEHLETYISKISRGISIVDRKYKISISVYDNCPYDSHRTFTTLGLSHYFIDYYYEFILVCKSRFNENEIASFLTSFSEFLLDNKKGIKRGDVMTFDFNITSETKMNSLYFTLPFYFDDELQQLELEDRKVIFPIIIPIYDEEAELIKEKGWETFEAYLEENEIDNLTDLGRSQFTW